MTTTVVVPMPNSSMITGTRADSGALTNRLTHMPANWSTAVKRPISAPSGTPTRMASAMPRAKLTTVIRAASRKVCVGTTVNSAATTSVKGGNSRTRPSRPTTSQTRAQRISDAIIGMRWPKTVMTPYST